MGSLRRASIFVLFRVVECVHEPLQISRPHEWPRRRSRNREQIGKRGGRYPARIDQSRAYFVIKGRRKTAADAASRLPMASERTIATGSARGGQYDRALPFLEFCMLGALPNGAGG